MTGKHKVWCDTHIRDVSLTCSCKPSPIDRTQLDIELRRAERERCAKVCDVFAEDARFAWSNYELQGAAAEMARRIARDIRLMED